MADEVELKLDLTPAAADALEAAALWGGAPDIAEQQSIYFDTPDQALSKAGLSLRIRRSAGKHIQTVKVGGAGAAGLFVRSEWERPVSDDRPVLDNTSPVRTLLGSVADAIAPAFEIRIERRGWTVSDGDAVIELVLDRGEARISERTLPICEVELESKAGDPAALFALARRIDAVVPVRLGVESKAERGYRLARPAVAMAKAEPVGLTDEMTAVEAFRHIIQNCVRQFRLNEALLRADRAAGPLHQARVALRRMRTAFSIFKPIIGGNAHIALRKELRWLAGELGNARNLDVLLARTRPGLLQDRIAKAREIAYDGVGDALDSARARALLLDLAEWMAVGDWLRTADAEAERDQPIHGFAIATLERLRRKIKKEGRDLARLDDDARHEVRKDTKKLRYAAEFFASLFDDKRARRRHGKFVAALEELQDRIGALNDLATAARVLEDIGVEGDPDAAELLAGGKRKALLEAAAEARDDMIDMKRFWR